MKKVFALLLFACIATAANMTVQAPVKSVTAYSNGFAFVARSGQVSLPQGTTTLHVVNFTDLAVPHSITPSVSVPGSRVAEHYYYTITLTESTNATEYFTLGRLLNQSVGKTVSFTAGNDSVSGTLVWYGDGMLGVSASGGSGVSVYRISDLGRMTLPATSYSEAKQVNTTKTERGLAVAASGASGTGTLSLSYVASGAEWAASYKYYISSEADAGTGTLQGRATVTNNAGEDWDNVSLKLVVGNPHIESYAAPFRFYDQAGNAKSYAAGATAAPEAAFNQFTASPLSAYYVYALGVPATVKNGEERVLPLLENNVSYEREYFWDTYQATPEKVFIVNNTGGEAWAEGVIGVYLNGEFLGEASADYTPRGKEARVSVSGLPDIKVKKETVNQSSTATANSRTTTYRMRLTLENGMAEDVKLRVDDHLYGGDKVELVSSSLAAELKADGVIEWKPQISQGGTLEIAYEYSVTNYYVVETPRPY
ncbi:MAG: DUF4139 domain-containing protein [Candidatus ainarchaeum sp.]|nr:DUF4139 domain-containing protein [Candidatus ainarchaeum sp.]